MLGGSHLPATKEQNWKTARSFTKEATIAGATKSLSNAPLAKWEGGSLQNFYELVRFQQGAP